MPGPGEMDEARTGDRVAIAVGEIEHLALAEAAALARIRQAVDPDQPQTAANFLDDVRRLVDGGGRAWLVRRQGTIAGYASVMPAPGLPGLNELDGFIGPAFQRQGLASFLLATIVEQLVGSGVRQLFYPTPDTDSPAARFLLNNGFFIEHEEQLLLLEDLSALPGVKLGPGFALRTFGRRPAIIAHFRRLYREAFAGLAWFQPYEDDQEVARDLEDAGDLLFLAERSRLIGFLWLRWPDLRSAEIEPVGLLPAYRGRGLGRQLLLAGLSRAAQQGATRAWVGAWRTNAVALALYRQLGFRPAGRKYYLAYDL